MVKELKKGDYILITDNKDKDFLEIASVTDFEYDIDNTIKYVWITLKNNFRKFKYYDFLEMCHKLYFLK